MPTGLVGHQSIPLPPPIDQRIGSPARVVTPAGRFADERQFNPISQLSVKRSWDVAFRMRRVPCGMLRINVKRPAVEKVPMHTIGKQQAEFLIGP